MKHGRYVSTAVLGAGLLASAAVPARAGSGDTAASAGYLLRNIHVDGDRAKGGNSAGDPVSGGYTLRSVHLGGPLHGESAGGGYTLRLLSGTWRPDAPLPAPEPCYAPRFDCPGDD